MEAKENERGKMLAVETVRDVVKEKKTLRENRRGSEKYAMHT